LQRPHKKKGSSVWKQPYTTDLNRAQTDHRVHVQPDVQNFDLLIEDMESAGQAWAIWASLKVLRFSANPKRRTP